MIKTIYILGAAIVAILTLIFFAQVKIILFPAAMLPMEFWELAQLWLAVGFLPMSIATILFRRKTARRGKIFLVPAIICFGFIISLALEVAAVLR